MKVQWTHVAYRRLEEIYAYIEKDSPLNASKWSEKLLKKIEGIKSRNVWVIDIDVIKTINARGETKKMKGEEIIKAQYSVLTSFDQNGLAFFEKKDGALIVNGYLNKTGKIIKHWSYKG